MTPNPPSSIRAGELADLPPAPGDWIIIDVGFSQKQATCGFLAGGVGPKKLAFGALQSTLVAAATSAGGPLNLVIEAPLSVAFAQNGNPAGRNIERRGNLHRYWHAGLGTTVLLSAMHLLRGIVDAKPRRDIRLFEGFVSFKSKGRSDHCGDVLLLRDVIAGASSRGRIVMPEELRRHPDDSLRSAFAVAGMDFGVPPVVLVTGEGAAAL
jgi:hypothetical protein